MKPISNLACLISFRAMISWKFESKKETRQLSFTYIKPNGSHTYEQSFCAFFDSVFTDPEISIPRANKICVQVRAAILSSSIHRDKSLGTSGRFEERGRGKENFVLFGCVELLTLKSFNHPNEQA